MSYETTRTDGHGKGEKPQRRMEEEDERRSLVGGITVLKTLRRGAYLSRERSPTRTPSRYVTSVGTILASASECVSFPNASNSHWISTEPRDYTRSTNCIDHRSRLTSPSPRVELFSPRERNETSTSKYNEDCFSFDFLLF